MDKRLQMPTSVVQLTLKYLTFNGDQAANIVYVRRKSGGAGVFNETGFDDNAADSQAANAVTAWSSAMAPITFNGVGLQEVDWCYNTVQGTGPLREGVHAVGGGFTAGAVGGPPLPLGISKAFTLRTGFGGRGGHGRFFMCGLTVAQVSATDPDQLTAGSISSFNAAAAAFLADMNNNNLVAGVGDKFTLVVVSFFRNHALRTPAVANDVTRASLSTTVVDYQRRRSTGHGRHH